MVLRPGTSTSICMVGNLMRLRVMMVASGSGVMARLEGSNTTSPVLDRSWIALRVGV